MRITGGFDACQCNSLLEAIYFGRNDFEENSLIMSYKVPCIRYWFQSKIWQCWLIFREKSVFFSSQSPKTNQLDFIYYKLRRWYLVPKPSSQNDSQSRFQRNEIPCGENTVYIKNFIKIWSRYIYHQHYFFSRCSQRFIFTISLGTWSFNESDAITTIYRDRQYH